ncbi:MAG: hypothetical protein ACPK85_05620 [Methanosarcina sp.]
MFEMFELPEECVRCGTELKKQTIGSNEFYYCRKCGCTSSITFISLLNRCAVPAPF